MADLEKLRESALEDSQRWFPECHETDERYLIHAGLGLAGEAGEVVDVIKKWHRRPREVSEINKEALGAELADAFIYLLHICSATGIDLEAEYHKKRTFNEARFSNRTPEREAEIERTRFEYGHD